MKKKILIILFFGIVTTFFIYKFNKQDKIYFLSLGDGLATGMTAYYVEGYSYNDYIRDKLEKEDSLKKYLHEFSETGQTVENLITSIEHNYKLEELNLTIQQALAKANIITLGIGMDELSSKVLKQSLTTKEKEEYQTDINTLLKLIRNFNDKEIYLLGIYKAYNLKEEDVSSINSSLKELAGVYHIKYIDISDVTNHPEFFLTNNSYYLNYKGHLAIANKILER